MNSVEEEHTCDYDCDCGKDKERFSDKMFDRASKINKSKAKVAAPTPGTVTAQSKNVISDQDFVLKYF